MPPFSDYRKVWIEVLVRDAAFIARGRSVCATDPDLDGPAIWTAGFREARVDRWRVYEGTVENRARIGVEMG